MKTLNVVELTVTARAAHYCRELVLLAKIHGALTWAGCPDLLRIKLNNNAKALLKSLEELAAAQEAPK